MKKPVNVKIIVLSGLFIALDIILARFPLMLQMGIQGKITFSFIAMIVAASILGPWRAMVIAFLSDFLGYSLFPHDGAYFFGYAATAMFIALVYGLLFYKKTRVFTPVANGDGAISRDSKRVSQTKTFIKILFCCILVFLINIITISLWNTILYTKPVPDMFMVKYISNITVGLPGRLINLVLQFLLIPLIFRYLDFTIKKYEI